MAELTGVPKALLRCAWVTLEQDSELDTDQDPDISSVKGIVTLRCSEQILRSVPLKAGFVMKPLIAEFSPSGVLVPKGTSLGGNGIWLPACGSPDLLPSNFSYTAEFDLLDENDKPIPIKPFTFQIFESEDPEGTDLTELMFPTPLPPEEGGV